jgi:hypothetical protein
MRKATTPLASARCRATAWDSTIGLIDGADGGKFMSAFKRVLEGWDREIG